MSERRDGPRKSLVMAERRERWREQEATETPEPTDIFLCMYMYVYTLAHMPIHIELAYSAAANRISLMHVTRECRDGR